MTTHVLVITDKSGSMYGLASDVRGGFNSYINELRADKNGDYSVTVTLFDTECESLCINVPLSKVPAFTEDNYHPGGMTALLDAVGETIQRFENNADVCKHDRVLVVVQTDGRENSSREWSKDKIKKLIKDREATEQWTFIYLGAGAEAWNQGGQYGMGMQVNTVSTSWGTRSSYRGLAQGTIAYASGTSGAEASGLIRSVVETDAVKHGVSTTNTSSNS